MLKATLFITTLLCTISSSFGVCSVIAPSDIIMAAKANKESIANEFVFKNCTSGERNSFLEHITDYSGTLHPRAIKLAYNTNVNQKINIFALEEFLSDKIRTKEGIFIMDAQIVGQNKKHLTFQEFDDLDLECSECIALGEHSAKLTHINKTGKKVIYWINFKTKKKVKVLSSLSSQRVAHNSLDPKSFKWDYIFTEKPEDYFTDLKHLSFFKANRTISEGSSLLRSYLTPVTLVRSGDIATIKMRVGNIKLKGKGKAMRPGKFGDIISLRNTRTKKVIMGKVIDKNTIEAQL